MSSNFDADKDFIAAAMPAFISEAAEQIEAIETLLLELEEQPNDRELLDSLFRCAHTVKGSAGIFGLNRVVANCQADRNGGGAGDGVGLADGGKPALANWRVVPDQQS